MKGLKVLLWKNFRILSREKLSLAISLLIPLVCVSSFAALRVSVKVRRYTESTTYEAFSVQEIPPVVRNVTNAIYYAPSNPLTDSIMQLVLDNSFSSRGLNYSVIGFGGVGQLENLYKEVQGNLDGYSGTEVLAGVIFTNLGGKRLPENITYTLKFPGSQRTKYQLLRDQGNARPNWYTGKLYPYSTLGGPRSRKSKYGGFPGYFDEGYLYLQYAINEAIVKKLLNSTQVPELEEYDLRLQRFPAPPFTDDKFAFILQFFLPFIVAAGFTYNVLELTKQLIHEKSSRLKEFMKIMGLPSWLHWLAWFIRSYILLLFVVIIMVFILKLEIKDGISVLTHSDPLVLFFILSIYIINVITYSFLFSTMFANENAGSTIAALVWIVSSTHSYPYVYEYFQMSAWDKALTCFLSSNTPMFFIINFLHFYESLGEGLHWDNLWHGLAPNDDFSVGICIAMIAVNSVVCFLAAMYNELAFPGKYGVALPWYFPFTIWFWTGKSQKAKVVQQKKARSKADAFEADPQNLEAGVILKNLTKVFGSKVAVNNLSFNMYSDQVTSLLGPNGAGKSTIMSILTGLIRPTAGTAWVNSYDIKTEMTDIRKSLGLCPQYNILFDNLTVEEHFKFYCQLKGLNEAETLSETERCVSILDLEDKRKTQSKYLSGGMKRKLCVGIALSAGSKVVILDEPTAGIDPEARRSIWDLIQAEKKGRTIMLSTHYMEEADVLGDRVAIIIDGELVCCGSSLFLKSKFGNAYNLVVVKNEGASSDKIKAVIMDRISSVEFKADVQTQISCSLPVSEIDAFSLIFEELENRKEELGIQTYGVGSTTLEEIFFCAMNDANKTNSKTAVPGKSIPQSLFARTNLAKTSSESTTQLHRKSKERNRGVKLLWQQFRALVKKKFIIFVRRRSVILLQVIVPFVGIILAYMVINMTPGMEDPKAEVNSVAHMYERMGIATSMFSCLPDSQICQAFKSILQDYHHIIDVEDTPAVPALLDTLSELHRREEGKYTLAFEEELDGTQSRKKFTLFFNNQPFHVPPVAVNLIFNGLLKLHGLTNTIITTNKPFAFTKVDDLKSTSYFNSCYMLATDVIAMLTFLAGAFVILPLSETASKFKNLQVLAGTKLPLYWLADFLVNMISVAVSFMAIVIASIVYDLDPYASWEVRLGILTSLLWFSFASISFCMLMSTLMKDPSVAYARILAINVFALIAFAANGLLHSPELDILSTLDTVNDIISFVPVYGLSMAVYLLGKNRRTKMSCSYFDVTELCFLDPSNPCCSADTGYYEWDDPGIGKYLARMSGLSILFLILLIMMETGVIASIGRIIRSKRKHKAISYSAHSLELQDADVLAENRRVNYSTVATLNRTDNLIVKSLTKTYKGKFAAVNNISFGVKKGEVFGLLGINGAGKTSTFQMLTGNTTITGGDAFIDSYSVKHELQRARSYLGYCPQFDACIDELTGRETLKMFARLKGIPEENINDLVKRTAENLLFQRFLDKRFGSLSGGNKRKLSTAIAMLGDPAVILLDEPSAGMDPVSRRQVWNAIGAVRDAGTSILLTSHDMGECEALCSTLAIMVKGELKCLGSPQHLKSKLLPSYRLILQLASEPHASCSSQTSDDRDDWELTFQRFQEFLKTKFPGCVLKDVHFGFLEYQIPKESATWAKVFAAMQEAKGSFVLEGYTVSQVDLEQVFCKFASE